MNKPSVLIGSCICQTPMILARFIRSLQNLNLLEINANFLFIDDNQLPESKDLLQVIDLKSETIIKPAPPRERDYRADEKKHYWNSVLVARVASLKNEIIAYAKEKSYDYLFLIDSDLLIDKNLIHHLVSQKKDIISEIFWTSWRPDTVPLPNVWLYDIYEMSHPGLDADTRQLKKREFLDQLRIPGVYQVGGLGACTLISARALKAGVGFSPIKNISFWGEDRWFCIRAAVLGLELFVDTHYPAKHLYRESDL